MSLSKRPRGPPAMQGLLRPRRLLNALGILVVFWVAGVATAGVDQGIEGEGGPLPAGFRLAEERVGDAAQYDLSLVRVTDAGAEVLEEHPITGIEWMAPEPTRGHDGRSYDTNRVHQWGWQKDDEGQWDMYAQPVWAVDKATRRVVAYSYMHNGDLEVTRSTSTHFVGPDDVHVIPCGVANAYSGREVPLQRDVVFFRDCSWPDHWSPRESFRAVATQRLGGVDTVLFTRDGPSAIHMWFQEGVPYPVRLASQDQDDPAMWHVHRMTLFHRGDGPAITWDGGAPGPEEPPLQTAPRTGGLHPDESGVPHPFPLSAALEASKPSANATDFWAILDGGGYLAFASPSAFLGDGAVSRTWILRATDGQTHAGIGVIQETTGSPTPWQLWPYVPGLGDVGKTTSIKVVRQEADDWGFPRPEQVPDQWPTAAFLLARWQAHATSPYREMPADGWGFTVRCAVSRDDCNHVLIDFEAGVDHGESSRQSTSNPLAPSTTSNQYHSVYTLSWDQLRGNGSRLWEFQFDGNGGTSQDTADDAPLPPFTTAQLESADEVTTFSTLAWVAPAAPWVAASGAAALLMAAAYLLWPLAKGGALGMFSRVESPQELAQHPVRARVLALVEAEPGLHVRGLASRLGLARSHVAHHLRQLERGGLVRVVKGPGYTCVFRKGAMDASLMGASTWLKAPGARAVLALSLRSPGVGPREAASQLGMSPGTVAYHLKRLREAGLLEAGQGLASTELGRRAAAMG